MGYGGQMVIKPDKADSLSMFLSCCIVSLNNGLFLMTILIFKIGIKQACSAILLICISQPFIALLFLPYTSVK